LQQSENDQDRQHGFQRENVDAQRQRDYGSAETEYRFDAVGKNQYQYQQEDMY
jgi:hypothetical protein